MTSGAGSAKERPAPRRRAGAFTVGPHRREVITAFGAVLRRDLYATSRELPAFLAQVILQPLFLLFVFGRVLGELGLTRPGYTDLLFPGIVALTALLTALQRTAFPLVIDFSFTKEIEDRLLAPLPVGWLALEKILFAALQGLIAAALMFPIGALILTDLPLRAAGIPLAVAVLLLGSLVGGALGLTIGTLVPPTKINVVFALVLTPILFTGSSQYPWLSLDRLRWFQVVTAANPLTYASEGMRAALTPSSPTSRPGICLLVLTVALVALAALGTRGFLRRAVD